MFAEDRGSRLAVLGPIVETDRVPSQLAMKMKFFLISFIPPSKGLSTHRWRLTPPGSPERSQPNRVFSSSTSCAMDDIRGLILKISLLVKFLIAFTSMRRLTLALPYSFQRNVSFKLLLIKN